MNNRLAFIQTFFNGSFEAFQTQYDESTSFELAFNLTIEKYSNQPIYRDSILEFKEWYKQLIDSNHTVNYDN